MHHAFYLSRMLTSACFCDTSHVKAWPGKLGFCCCSVAWSNRGFLRLANSLREMHISKLISAPHPVLPRQNAHLQADAFLVSFLICRRGVFYFDRMHTFLLAFFLNFAGLKTPRGSGRKHIFRGPKSVDPHRCWLLVGFCSKPCFLEALCLAGSSGPSPASYNCSVRA